ncbi:MAG: bifunctional folylpolyglutamate synthase/dihydrofolate synthase, partial [candidate division WOR-3 bacterium]
MGGVIAKLNSLIDYEKRGGYTKSLEPFLNLLEILGNPHLKLKNVIHIVGTKGKGSVSHIVSRGL